MPYYRLFYHFVWATKHRLPLISPANRTIIYQTIRAKVEEKSGVVHALNGMEDHVHLVVTVPPKQALSAFIGPVKGASSRAASRIEPFEWQDEYSVLSVSESHLAIVVRYVDHQQQHHAEKRLNARLEMMG